MLNAFETRLKSLYVSIRYKNVMEYSRVSVISKNKLDLSHFANFFILYCKNRENFQESLQKAVIYNYSVVVVTTPSYSFNIARCIVNSICQMAGKLESHCTLQILNE